MRCNDFVLDAKVVKSKDILSRTTLKCVKVLDLEVVLAPL